MGWDPTVLRKYNTTGHFRLLNQLRGELQSHPMPRRDAQAPEKGTASRDRRAPRTVEVRPQSYGRGRRSSAGFAAAPIPAAAVMAAAAVPSDGGSASSFRDRLNAIEMR